MPIRQGQEQKKGPQAKCLRASFLCRYTVMASGLIDNLSLQDSNGKDEAASLLFIAPAYGDIALQGAARFKVQELAEQSFCQIKIVEDEEANH